MSILCQCGTLCDSLESKLYNDTKCAILDPVQEILMKEFCIEVVLLANLELSREIMYFHKKQINILIEK